MFFIINGISRNATRLVSGRQLVAAEIELRDAFKDLNQKTLCSSMAQITVLNGSLQHKIDIEVMAVPKL